MIESQNSQVEECQAKTGVLDSVAHVDSPAFPETDEDYEYPSTYAAIIYGNEKHRLIHVRQIIVHNFDYTLDGDYQNVLELLYAWFVLDGILIYVRCFSTKNMVV